eukprot:TRINITY_DN4970_c0_g2_i1.p1 TRINITY_DN4970_c0_g2~~TRINITY_DN4970_c0_g2_i1.p1  ORF type:complete len:267 (-),score=59.52 TRINITY_DN4970_c0_g2_i1:52-852(-)
MQYLIKLLLITVIASQLFSLGNTASCSVPGVGSGNCQDKSKFSCSSGSYYAGYCKGANEIQCCVRQGSATVQDKVNAAGCTTTVVSGLSAQLIAETNKLKSGLFTNLNTLTGLSMSSATKAVPYLQTKAANGLQKAINERGTTITINSGLRTLPQQLLLYKWYKNGKCGIPAAAKPGNSNHNGGLAIDIKDPYAWKTALEHHGWKKLGDWDQMHYDFPGGSNIKSLSIKAFQNLWNKHNPNDQIDNDGLWGPTTERKLLESPAAGW